MKFLKALWNFFFYLKPFTCPYCGNNASDLGTGYFHCFNCDECGRVDS